MGAARYTHEKLACARALWARRNAASRYKREVATVSTAAFWRKQRVASGGGAPTVVASIAADLTAAPSAVGSALPLSTRTYQVPGRVPRGASKLNCGQVMGQVCSHRELEATCMVSKQASRTTNVITQDCEDYVGSTSERSLDNDTCRPSHSCNMFNNLAQASGLKLQKCLRTHG